MKTPANSATLRTATCRDARSPSTILTSDRPSCQDCPDYVTAGGALCSPRNVDEMYSPIRCVILRQCQEQVPSTGLYDSCVETTKTLQLKWCQHGVRVFLHVRGKAPTHCTLHTSIRSELPFLRFHREPPNVHGRMMGCPSLQALELPRSGVLAS